MEVFRKRVPDGRTAVRRPGRTPRILRRQSRLTTWLLGAIFVLLLGWTLRATAVVAVPLVSALFIALMLAPLDRWIAERLPSWLEWLGRAAVVAVLLLVLAAFFAGLVYSARQVIEEMPDVTESLADLMPEGAPMMELVERSLERQFSTDTGTQAPSDGDEGTQEDETGDNGEEADEGTGQGARNEQDENVQDEGGQEREARDAEDSGDGTGQADETPVAQGSEALRDLVNQAGSVAGSWVAGAASGLAQNILAAIGTFIAATIIVVFMVLLALGETSLWTRKLHSLWPGAGERNWRQGIEVLSVKLRQFLLMRLAMGALSATLYVVWLYLFEVRLLPVWAILTLLLSFIPNLGSVLSGVLPTLYALVTKDFQTALLIGGGLFAIEQIVGNFVDPRLQGRQIAISPLVVLAAILVWGWLWGIAGALLAVPMTIAIMVACAQVPELRPIALILSDQSEEEELMAELEL